MSLGPAEILVILVVALIVFGPKRLPEVGRQVGSAMRELRKMQDSVRHEIHGVLHSDVTPPDSSNGSKPPAVNEPDHTTWPEPRTIDAGETDDGFTGPTSFS